MTDVYIGIDPSWKEFGLTVINTGSKEIHMNTTRYDYNSKQLYNIRKFCRPIVWYLEDFIENNIPEEQTIHAGIEFHSTYGSFNQGELLVLDNMLLDGVDKLMTKRNLYYNIYYQTYLTYVTGHKSSDKVATALLVQEIIEIFKKHGYTINIAQTRKTRDNGIVILGGEADSFMYALRQLIKYTPECPLTSDITEFIPKIKHDKEIC